MLPKRHELPGILLTFGLAAFSFVWVWFLPYSNFFSSEVLIVTLASAAVVNTPLRKLIGFTTPTLAGPNDLYLPGLRYVGLWLVRLSVMLLGLQLKPRFFRVENLAIIAGVAAVSVPGCFLATHIAGRLLRLRRPLVDLLAAGTMICGASAINAIGPVVRARREDQSVAVSTVFLYSAVAMLTFHPMAQLFSVDAVFGGLWAGLAVNDLSSALAVGRMVDTQTDASAVFSAMAKSARILLLVPALLGFQLLRTPSSRRTAAGSWRAQLKNAVPGFIVGYVVLALLRALGDSTIPSSHAWHFVLKVSRHVNELSLVMVSAAVGLHLDLRRLLGQGVRAVLVGGAAWTWTTLVTLMMLIAASQQRYAQGIAEGAAALAVVFVIYRLVARRGAAVAEEDDAGESPAVAESGPAPHGATQTVDLGSADVAGRRRRFALGGVTLAVGIAVLALTRQPAGASPSPALVVPMPADGSCPAGTALVPGGDFLFGAEDGFHPDEGPVVRRSVKSFCLDITEVTVARYAECVSTGVCTPARGADWPGLNFVSTVQWSALCNRNRADRQDHPVNCVDYFQAEVYCEAHGGRLPTEEEWEYAARGGSQQRLYPWGNDDVYDRRGNFCGSECPPIIIPIHLGHAWSTLYPEDDGWPVTAPVGSFPEGDGRWGHKDLAGNVTEFVLGRYCPYEDPDCSNDEAVVRGDGWMTNNGRKLRCARRNHDEPWHRSPDAGFRCMRPLP